jgi:hypothetical protein
MLSFDDAGRSPVIPAQAGIHLSIAAMDSRLRGNDGWGDIAGLTNIAGLW